MLPMKNSLPDATLVGRVWRPDASGASVVAIRGDRVVDLTSRHAPTMRDLMEMEDVVGYVQTASGDDLGSLAEISKNSTEKASWDSVHFLSPADLQVIKASGVTFAESMVERVIEEQAAGNADLAQEIRVKVAGIIGESLRGIVPGSKKAMQVKQVLIDEGLWSQYLEVGIGPDAEVFTKAQPTSSVGWGASVGLHPISSWNNPEPEIVLAVNSRGEIRGATLGNDVNLRDVEGRSALLLGKAKDNNASCSIGPFIRVFDDGYGMEEVCRAELTLKVEGEDGFVLDGSSSMTQISRDPESIVKQTIGRHHQYPDGFMLFLGTLFAPIQDRDDEGQGFTHKTGDVVEISEPNLGLLRNTVRLSTECPEWTIGIAATMRNLAQRGLI
ncbi:fumarylacetoacetate hydrolase family protein [Alisedimentitalea sp. MJ-SS2]|uniref:fumarylacetoacetate hydrolase family protein n=1 Tax=Aliisedimentitalea sp. MJ-SS2 TaxID=3049795 RepID=UPI0029120AA8|nr:fumarylacetoacetate hydrolase family protein [Alisedimentitalea sp. MJ-SS2]MDU8927047.1 fumarylacetoacetate hydrolase family protein [Alisedimentitalea sp. MJ-SS2]